MFNINLTNREKFVANSVELQRNKKKLQRLRLQQLAKLIDTQLTSVELNGLFVITIRNNNVIDIKEIDNQ